MGQPQWYLHDLTANKADRTFCIFIDTFDFARPGSNWLQMYKKSGLRFKSLTMSYEIPLC